jgi:hypothetical protein
MFAQREVDVVDRNQRAKALGHRLRLQNFNAHAIAPGYVIGAADAINVRRAGALLLC